MHEELHLIRNWICIPISYQNKICWWCDHINLSNYYIVASFIQNSTTTHFFMENYNDKPFNKSIDMKQFTLMSTNNQDTSINLMCCMNSDKYMKIEHA